MSWLRLSLASRADDTDSVSDAMEALGAAAVTVRPDGAAVLEPAPGEQPLSERNTVTGLFPGDADPARLVAALARVLDRDSLPDAAFDRLADAEWEQVWRQDAVARDFGGGLWVLPADAPVPAHAVTVVRLDPGLAFGTGAHPTTALCLSWLAGAALRERTVLDFGCGSGILAIAAAALGASRVYATDHDPQALAATRDNAARNGVGDRVRLTADPPVCDVLVANILANALLALAPRFDALVRPGGRIALSGILPEQAAALADRYAAAFAMEAPREADGWVLLCGRRRDTSCT